MFAVVVARDDTHQIFIPLVILLTAINLEKVVKLKSS